MMKNCEKSYNSNSKGTRKILTPEKPNSKLISEVKDNDRWRREFASRLLQKSESLEKARVQITKLFVNKNVLESKLKEKVEEIRRSNDKVSLLLRELSALKTDHLKALEEIKMLKIKTHESSRKNEIVEQKKSFYDEMEKEFVKSQQLLTREKLKTKKLEGLKLNLHGWRTMQYRDPHYFDVLLKKNYLQKELMKKIRSSQAKEAEMKLQNTLNENLQRMLQRRPYNLMKDPTEQMMKFYKTIQLQKERIKVLTAQVNMFESVFSDKYHKLSKENFGNEE